MVLLAVGFVACLALLLLLAIVSESALLPQGLVVGGVATYLVWTRYGWLIGIVTAVVAVAVSVLAMFWEDLLNPSRPSGD